MQISKKAVPLHSQFRGIAITAIWKEGWISWKDKIVGEVAELVDALLWGGSAARRGSSSLLLFTTMSGGNSSVGRAQPCQGWGREFESRFPLVEWNELKVTKASSLVFRSQSETSSRLKSIESRFLLITRLKYRVSFFMPRWRNGRRARFRCACREACRFESCSGHHKKRVCHLKMAHPLSYIYKPQTLNRLKISAVP